jgi:hypothetical protein
LAYVILSPPSENVDIFPLSFVSDLGITIQLSAVGGVRTEYAIPLFPYPVATHVPFPNVILIASLLKTVGENESGIPTHDSAVGGLAREYAMLFVPVPTATHAPFP